MLRRRNTYVILGMLGAIVENPGGNLFIKLAGPAKTIAANQAKFDQLVASFAKDK